jgi:hypothetical protein
MIIWKNKGLLVVLYVVISLIATMGTTVFLGKKYGWELSQNHIVFFLGVAMIIAGLLTYINRFDYYKNREGMKVKMDTDNSLFFIKMEYWPYILGLFGLALMVISVFIPV